MIDFRPMWKALGQYQFLADKNGHGDSWLAMCEQPCFESVDIAESAIYKCMDADVGALFAVENAECAIFFAAEGLQKEAVDHSKMAIGHIKKAIRIYWEDKNVPS